MAIYESEYYLSWLVNNHIPQMCDFLKNEGRDLYSHELYQAYCDELIDSREKLRQLHVDPYEAFADMETAMMKMPKKKTKRVRRR